MHLTVSGTRDAVLMVEAGAKEVSEEADAATPSSSPMRRSRGWSPSRIEIIRQEIGKEKAEVPLVTTGEDVKAAVREFAL